jgi:hypothetical protein
LESGAVSALATNKAIAAILEQIVLYVNIY